MKKLVIGVVVGLVILVGLIGVGAKIAINRMVESQVDQALLDLPEGTDVEYGSADVSLLTQKLRFEDVSYAQEGSDQPIHIDEIIIHDVDDAWRDRLAAEGAEAFRNGGDMPRSLDLEMIGIEITEEMLTTQTNDAPDLAAFGYEMPMSANMAFKYDYNESDKMVKVDKMTVSLDDAFALDVDLHIGGLDLQEMANLGESNMEDPMQALGLLTAIELHSFNFTFTDNSLIERVLTAQAKEEGRTVEEIRNEALASLDEGLVGETDERALAMAAEMRDFIEDPDAITIGINPASPLTFNDLMPFMLGGEPSASDVANLFNLTVDSK